MRGVRRTRVGYTGGTTTNPTYNAVCRGSTGHSEALRIVFDPSVISFEDLLKAFFSMHAYQYRSKPQYMSAIFVQGDAQRTAAENFVAKLEQRGDVATRILPAAQWARGGWTYSPEPHLPAMANISRQSTSCSFSSASS